MKRQTVVDEKTRAAACLQDIAMFCELPYRKLDD